MALDPSNPRIPLQSTLHLREARAAEDDWTGKSDAKERRRLQNRLHQRAWRRRKAERTTNALPPNHPGSSTSKGDDNPLSTAFAAATAALLPHSPQAQRVSSVPIRPDHKLIPPVISYHSAACSQPTVTLHFPLSPDHYLITLIQYNVLRATLTNLTLVSSISSLPLECQAALTFPRMHDPPRTLPPSFRPTRIQRMIPHASWIDSVPCAQLRDNLIIGTFDEDELCDDIVDGLYSGFTDAQPRGLLVWGEPWCVESWEVTPAFWARWGFLLRGCVTLLESTNRWREGRGEEALVVEVE